MTPTTSFAIPAPATDLPPRPLDELTLAACRAVCSIFMALGVGVAMVTVQDGAPLALVGAAALSPVAARALEDDGGRAPWLLVGTAGVALGLAAFLLG